MLGERHFFGVLELRRFVLWCVGYDCGNKELMNRDLEKNCRGIFESIYTISLSFDGIGNWQAVREEESSGAKRSQKA